MKEQFSRLKDWMEGTERPPFKMKIMPSDMDQCNLSCKYCMRNFLDSDRVQYLRNSDGPTKNNISNEKYIELIDEAAELGVRRIGVVGIGEPMLNPGITDILERVKLHDINGNLTTNGTLFSREQVKKIIQMNWDLIAISLDAPDAKTQEKLRPSLDSKRSFAEVLKTLKLFQDLKEKLNKKLPEIILVPVMSRENFMKVPEIIELANEYSVERVEFKPLVTHGIKELEEYKVDAELRKDLQPEIEKSKKLARKYSIETNIEKFKHEEFTENSGDIENAMRKLTDEENEILSIPCYDPWLKIEVHPGEEMINPCPVPFKEYSEDIYEKSLKEVWYGKKFTELRNKLKNGEIPEFCKLCYGGNVMRNQSLRRYIKRNLS